MTFAGENNADLQVLQPRADAAVVLLRGEYDLANKELLHQTLTSLLETKQVVVVDLSDVRFIDSSTLGVLVRADRTARASGKHLRLQLGPEPIVKRVLEISGLLTVLDCYTSRDEALDPAREKLPDPLL